MNILESLKDKLLVADGAFGTCYVGMYGEQGTVAPELANMRHPERVLEIHKEYVKAACEAGCGRRCGSSRLCQDE